MDKSPIVRLFVVATGRNYLVRPIEPNCLAASNRSALIVSATRFLHPILQIVGQLKKALLRCLGSTLWVHQFTDACFEQRNAGRL